MISRLTTLAVTVVTLTGGSIALAATVSATSLASVSSSVSPAAKPVQVIELPRVTVIAKRLPA